MSFSKLGSIKKMAFIMIMVISQIYFLTKLQRNFSLYLSQNFNVEEQMEEINLEKQHYEEIIKSVVHSRKKTRSSHHEKNKKKSAKIYKNKNKHVHIVKNVTRVFPFYDHKIPCFPESDFNEYQDELRPLSKNITKNDFVQKYAGPNLRGLIYIKVPKTASSTLAGINLRIASRHSTKEGSRCASTYRHFEAKRFKIKNRIKEKAFVWTFIRDPTKQFVSQFYHFEVSRKKKPNTFKRFKRYVDKHVDIGPTGGTLFHPQMSFVRTVRGQSNPNELAETILNDFDFVGIVERFEESLVLLRLLLGLNAGDLLYISSKVNGGYDDGQFNHKCVKILPANLTNAMKMYLSSKNWYKRNKQFLTLLEAANRSLDATIQSIGKEVFDQALAEHRYLMALVKEKCSEKAIFPCSRTGVSQSNESKLNCYRNDNGCGYPCLDELYSNVTKDKNWNKFSKIA